MVAFVQSWLHSGNNGCNGTIMVCIWAKVFLFGQMWLLSGKSGCIRAKVVLFGQRGNSRAKVVIFGYKWLYSG